MEETLRQLGELLLTSIPTMIFLLVVWGAYLSLVYRPLRKVLDQRHALTEGALERARAEIASAEARTADYEEKVREARVHIFKMQEVRYRQIMEQRSAALAEARKQAQEMVKRARAATAEDVSAAKASLQKQAETLADEIIETILKPAVAAGSR